jgi:hypothetical protein
MYFLKKKKLIKVNTAKIAKIYPMPLLSENDFRITGNRNSRRA